MTVVVEDLALVGAREQLGPVDPGGDLSLDGPSGHSLGPVAADRGDHILAVGSGAMRVSVVDSFFAEPSSASLPDGVVIMVASRRICRRPSNSRMRLSVTPTAS
jgi:hypothetical protein